MVFTDTEMVLVFAVAVGARVLAAWQDRDNRPPEPSLGPRRPELLSALR